MAKDFKQFGVIDNALSEERYERLIYENFLLPYRTGLTTDFKSLYADYVPKSLDWTFYVDISDVGEEGIYVTDSSISTPQFNVTIINKANDTISPNYFNYASVIQEISDKIIKNSNFTGPILSRAKLNLILNSGPVKSHNIPHIDFTGPEPHLSCTLFLGDSDGDHIIFNETDKNLAAKGLPLSIADVYKHKPNRVVYNYGNYHCASPPINHDFRLALNWVIIFDGSSKLHKHNMNKKLATNLDKRYETT